MPENDCDVGEAASCISGVRKYAGRYSPVAVLAASEISDPEMLVPMPLSEP
jgi:hypothetical protein